MKKLIKEEHVKMTIWDLIDQEVTIDVYLYEEVVKRWFRKPKKVYTYSIITPTIDGYLDGHYESRNKIKTMQSRLKVYCENYILKLKNQESEEPTIIK